MSAFLSSRILVRYLAAAGLLAAPLTTLAQSVGIGTTTPNAAAVLDLTATGKGLLIPRMDSVTRAGIGSPPDGLMVFQTNGLQGFWYAMSGGWLYIPDKTRSGDNLGNHTATQTVDLNSQRLLGQANAVLGDSAAQVELIANVQSASAALMTRSNFGRLYSRTLLSGFGRGPYGQDIDCAVWGNAYRADGWGAIFSAGKPGSPKRWVGLAQHPGYVGAGAAIRIVDGTEGAGKVLTSDGVGTASGRTPRPIPTSTSAPSNWWATAAAPACASTAAATWASAPTAPPGATSTWTAPATSTW